ncbi:MAG: transposase [Lewinella sp.]|nr:transposase [Lewinella sp.]
MPAGKRSGAQPGGRHWRRALARWYAMWSVATYGVPSLRYKDYRDANLNKVMTLSATEFVRRLSLHLLPKGFCRIRHYGILAAAWKPRVFPQAGQQKATNWQGFWESKGLMVNRCPQCNNGTLVLLSTLDPDRGPPGTVSLVTSITQ